ncbi:MAG: NUDIX domain-containing protein [Pseudomonadota bacterium]
MFHLIPPPLHRFLLRIAHAVRLVYWRRFKPVLSACWVIGTDIDGKLLLVRTSYGRHRWQLPGGGVKNGEDPELAARRELREETGCEPARLTSLGLMEDTVVGAPSRNYVFTAIIEDSPEADGREVVEARFFPLHSLPEPLSGKTRARLEFWREKVREAREI